MPNRLGKVLIGTEAERPTSSSEQLGVFYVATDTNLIYRNSGAAWVQLAPSAGGAHDHTTADGSGVLSGDEHDSFSEYAEIAAPSSPAANKLRMYAKDSSGVSKLFYKDEAGTETGPLGTGSGGTTSLLRTIMLMGG